MKIKIAIAEDHPMTVKGIKETLGNYSSFLITGVFTTGMDLMKGLEMEQPDVLILDIQLPDKTGDQLAPLIKNKHPDVRILVLSNFDSPLYASKLVGHSALGYLLKTTDAHTLVEAIETVYAGNVFLEKDMRDKLEQLSSRKNRVVSQKTILTPKEKEVLQLIVNGDSSHEIAEKLFLSLHTVNNYRKNILLKMDAKNMADMVAKALKSGLVE